MAKNSINSKKKAVDLLYDNALFVIMGIMLLVIIAMEPSFVKLSNFTTVWPERRT